MGGPEGKRLEVAETWFWRILAQNSWLERKSNEEILNGYEEKVIFIKHCSHRESKVLGKRLG